VSRIAWIVTGVIGWTLLFAAFAVLAQPPVLCPLALPLDPADPIAVCQRQMTTEDTSAMSGAGLALFALWSGGLIVAAVLERSRIRGGNGTQK